MKERLSLKRITIAGLLAAAVCAASLVSVPIPTPIDNTRLHLGNIMCILSGLLMGGFRRLLCRNRLFFFDLLNPEYIASAPFTLVFKFFIGFIAGSIAFAGAKRPEYGIKHTGRRSRICCLCYFISWEILH